MLKYVLITIDDFLLGKHNIFFLFGIKFVNFNKKNLYKMGIK